MTPPTHLNGARQPPLYEIMRLSPAILFFQVIGVGLVALGSIIINEMDDHAQMTSRDVMRPFIAIICVGVVFTFVSIFGAYGGCYQARNCLIVVSCIPHAHVLSLVYVKKNPCPNRKVCLPY